MITVVIRGVPNHGHLEYIQVENIDDIFNLFEVQGKESIFGSFEANFLKDGKNVSLYLKKDEHDKNNIGKYCNEQLDHAFNREKENYMGISPDTTNPTRLKSSGTGDWYEFLRINAKNSPKYPKILEILKKERSDRLKKERYEKEKEEENEQQLREEVEKLLSRFDGNYEKLIDAIKGLKNE